MENEIQNIVEKYQWRTNDDSTRLEIKNDINNLLKNEDYICDGVSMINDKLNINFSNGKGINFEFKKA